MMALHTTGISGASGSQGANVAPTPGPADPKGKTRVVDRFHGLANRPANYVLGEQRYRGVIATAAPVDTTADVELAVLGEHGEQGAASGPSGTRSQRELFNHRQTDIPVSAAHAMEDVRNAQNQMFLDLTATPKKSGSFLMRHLHSPNLAAMAPEAINLTVIAACVFGLTRGGGQTLGIDEIMGQLKKTPMTQAQKQAVASAVGVIAGGVFAGVGVLVAQVVLAPLVNAMFRAASAPLIGNYKFEPVPAEAVVPDPSPFLDDGMVSGLQQPKSLGRREAEMAWTGGQREQVKARQANHGLDNWFSSNAIWSTFMFFHGLRIGYTGTSGSPMVETFKTGAASGLGGGSGQLMITARKKLDTMPVIFDRAADGLGKVEQRPVFYLKNNDPEFEGLSSNVIPAQLQKARDRIKAEMSTAFDNYRNGRPLGELAKFTGVQFSKHAGAVMLSTAAVVLMNYFAGPVTKELAGNSAALVLQAFQAFLTFGIALPVLVDLFPFFAKDRKPPTGHPLAMPTGG